jgi:hypothetical protein
MVLEALVAVLVVLLTMLVAIRLVRVAANLLIILVCGGACGFAAFNILDGLWEGWSQIVVYSAATGAVAAMLCLPALPFSKFRRD